MSGFWHRWRMTEAEWLSGSNSGRMLDGFRERVDERKAQLFAAACCRRVWHLISEERCRALIERAWPEPGIEYRIPLSEGACREVVAALERLVDGDREAESRLARALRMVGAMVRRGRRCGLHLVADVQATLMAAEAVLALESPRTWIGMVSCAHHAAQAIYLASPRKRGAAQHKEQAAQCDLIRDIFGNPFRPARFQLGWRSPEAVGIARSARDGGIFDALPILGDALEEAGCDDRAILDHCRSGGVHVRGCWVVDLVLGNG